MQAILQKKLEQLKTDGIPAKYLAELAHVRFTTAKLDWNQITGFGPMGDMRQVSILLHWQSQNSGVMIGAQLGK